MSTRVKKILIVGPAWIGDMVMAQSLFTLLHAQPGVEIDVLAPKHSGAVATRMPEIHSVIELPIGHGELALKKRFTQARALAAKHYDEAYVLPNSFKSALIPFFAGIPVRTGWVGECRWGLLNDARLLNKTTHPLMIERFQALAFPRGQSLPNDLPWPKLVADANNALQLKQKYRIGVDGKPMIALCPGAEYGPAKRWPAAYYAQVADHLLAKGWDVCLLGSPKEEEEAKLIMTITNNRCINLIGKTALVDAIDVMSLANAVVCNDSGLMHIAAALDIPMVAIYGSSSTAFTPPLSKRVEILHLHLPCSPCFKRECPLGHLRCLKDIHPEQVLRALSQWVEPHACVNR